MLEVATSKKKKKLRKSFTREFKLRAITMVYAKGREVPAGRKILLFVSGGHPLVRLNRGACQDQVESGNENNYTHSGYPMVINAFEQTGIY